MARKALLVLAAVAVLVLGVSLLRPESRSSPLVGVNSDAPQIAPDAPAEAPTQGVETVVAEEEQIDPDEPARNVLVDDRLPPPVQALPSVPGFDLRPEFGHLTRRLAAETRDPGWAAQMEARIREIVGNKFPMDGLEVECRMSTCGIVLVGEFIALQDEQRELFQNLPAVLGKTLSFEQQWNTARRGAVGRAFTAIYLLDAAGRKTFVPEPLLPESEPLPPIPALPGISGFDVPSRYGDLQDHPAQTLANEPEDPAWSTHMEGRILGEISTTLSGFTASQIQVVCRTSICGVVIDYTPGPNIGFRLMEIERRLVEALDFRSRRSTKTRRADGSNFTAIWLLGGNQPDDTAPVRP